MNRETWLQNAVTNFARPLFAERGYAIPVNLRIGVGWPSKSAMAKKKRRLGEAWSNECSEDKTYEIIISPYLAKAPDVLAVLIHEVVHVTVGVHHGHKKAFSRCAAEVGLVKPWTATTAGGPLLADLTLWVTELGPYPHAVLDHALIEKKQTTRMLLLECSCGLKVRTTQKWLDTYGLSWPCPCGDKLVAANSDSDDGDGDGE